MTDLNSYIVVLNFAPPGILIVSAQIARDEASAVALAAVEAMQKMRHLEAPPTLMNCLVAEETVESLRHRLRAIDGRGSGGVVSLVREQVDYGELPVA